MPFAIALRTKAVAIVLFPDPESPVKAMTEASGSSGSRKYRIHRAASATAGQILNPMPASAARRCCRYFSKFLSQSLNAIAVCVCADGNLFSNLTRNSPCTPLARQLAKRSSKSSDTQARNRFCMKIGYP